MPLTDSLCQSHVTFSLLPAYQVRPHSSVLPSPPGGRTMSCSTGQLICLSRQNLVPCHSPSNMSSTFIESHPAPREFSSLIKPEPTRRTVVESPPESGETARERSARNNYAGSSSVVGDKSIHWIVPESFYPAPPRFKVLAPCGTERSRHQRMPPLCAVVSR